MSGLVTSLDPVQLILAAIAAVALIALLCCLLGWWALGAGGLRQAWRPDRGDERFHRR